MSQSGRNGISALMSLNVVSSLIACPLAEISPFYSTSINDPKGILKAMSSKAVIGFLFAEF